MKGFTKEIKIACTVIMAIFIVYFGIIWLKGLKIFNNDKEYVVVMDNVSGLNVSSDVLANGLKVGYVKNISYNSKNQKMALVLDIAPTFELPEGTTVFVTKEMLGSAKPLDITAKVRYN